MLGQSTIGIFKAKADYMRNCKVAVEGNVSGIEPFVRDPGKRALAGITLSRGSNER
jgi:hypothetical protein